MDGRGELAGEQEAAAGRQAGLAMTRNDCPAAAGVWRKRHTVLSAQRCLCTLCHQFGRCNSAAWAGAAGGLATAHSGRSRGNMAL